VNAQEKHQQQMSARTAQVRIKKGHIVDGYCGGTLVWMTPQRAQMFLTMQVVDLIGGPVVGPREFKSGESSGARTIGHSTDLAPFIQSGEGELSSASAEGQASQQINAQSSQQQDSATNVESSSSTTRTNLPRTRTSSTSRMRDGGRGIASEKTSSDSPE